MTSIKVLISKEIDADIPDTVTINGEEVPAVVDDWDESLAEYNTSDGRVRIIVVGEDNIITVKLYVDGQYKDDSGPINPEYSDEVDSIILDYADSASSMVKGVRKSKHKSIKSFNSMVKSQRVKAQKKH